MGSRNPTDHPVFWCDELKRRERKRIADESLRDWKNRKLIERRSRAKEQSHVRTAYWGWQATKRSARLMCEALAVAYILAQREPQVQDCKEEIPPSATTVEQ